MSRPYQIPSPEDKENSPFTLPPIRSLHTHATPKPTTVLPPTPSTIAPPPPLHSRQDHNPNLITPVQPRTRQPFSSIPSSANHSHSQYHAQSMFSPQYMTTPMTNGHGHGHGQRLQQVNDNNPNGTTRLQTPFKPTLELGVPSNPASRKKQHPSFGPGHATPGETPGPFNSGYASTALKTPVSALTNRTMGRSISTPTLPINSLPGGTPFSMSATSTRYSPSSDSQRSASLSRSGVRGRGQMSFSPSPTPSSPTSMELSGIQPPAPFPGAYPVAYTRKDPVPTEDGEPEVGEGKRSGRQGAPSWNPWDYVLGEVPGGEQGPNQTPIKDGDDGKGNKVRRRFTKRELEALEVLWSISKSPSKYERQRLGAWLGVKTKHITVWFQNRRQEEKRYLREGAPVDPPPQSRSNRGTFDPVTGKWRPVPLSCISGLQPPPEEKSAVVRSISVGDFTRDMYFAQHPHSEAHLPTPTPGSARAYTNVGDGTPVPKRGMSNSLDDVLYARETGFDEKRQFRRGSSDVQIKGEGQERIREILALMPSDPPSMDLSEAAVDEEDSETGEDDAGQSENSPKRKTLGTGGGPMGLARMLNGPSGSGLGRTSSLDMLASSSRTKYTHKFNGHGSGARNTLGAINPNIPSARQSLGSSAMTPKSGTGTLKRGLPPAQPPSAKRIRADPARPRPTTTFRHKDSFSRSQSAAVLDSPQRKDGDKARVEMKTPGFTRSFSFSSTVSEGVAITPESATVSKGNKETAEPSKAGLKLAGDVKKGDLERDDEVIDAAQKLLQLFGAN